MEDFQTPADWRGGDTVKMEGALLSRDLGLMEGAADTSTASFMHDAATEARVRAQLEAKKRAAPSKKEDDSKPDPLVYEVDTVVDSEAEARWQHDRAKRLADEDARAAKKRQKRQKKKKGGGAGGGNGAGDHDDDHDEAARQPAASAPRPVGPQMPPRTVGPKMPPMPLPAAAEAEAETPPRDDDDDDDDDLVGPPMPPSMQPQAAAEAEAEAETPPPEELEEDTDDFVGPPMPPSIMQQEQADAEAETPPRA